MMIANLFICSKPFPHFFFFEYTPGKYFKRGVEDEEISTFWQGHRNRCLIFSCELSKKQNVNFWTVIVIVFQYIT